MNKTLKQIADEIGVSKQKIYRYVKDNHITETVQDGQAKLYNETVQMQIKSHFSQNETLQQTTSVPHSDTAYDALLKQLEIKDQQLAEKDKQINLLLQTVDQEQKLHMLTEQKIIAIEQKSSSKKWRLFKRDSE